MTMNIINMNLKKKKEENKTKISFICIRKITITVIRSDFGV